MKRKDDITVMDDKLQLIEYNITASLEPRVEELKFLFSNQKCKNAIDWFFTHGEKRELYVYRKKCSSGVLLHASTTPPDGNDATEKFLVFVKKDAIGKISCANQLESGTLLMEWNISSLLHFATLTRYVFLPYFNNVSEYIHKGRDLIQILHNTISLFQVNSSKLKGETMLSIPNMEVLTKAVLSGNHKMHFIHLLETTLVGWIKQIKIALKLDLVNYMENRHGGFMKPNYEVEFWSSRLKLLRSLNEQLCSTHVVSVLFMLEEMKSSYCNSFHLIKQDINQAENEVVENLMFLRTLQKYINKIDDAETSVEIIKWLPPLFQTVLLIWTYSGYYRAEENIYRLLNSLSNFVMEKSQNMIAVGRSKIEMLQKSLQICSMFCGTYADFKRKADAIVSHKLAEEKEQKSSSEEIKWYSFAYKNSITPRGVGLFGQHNKKDVKPVDEASYQCWPDRTSKCFYHINIFIERCSDVLELAEATTQFEDLHITTTIGAGTTQVENNQLIEIQNIFKTTSNLICNKLMETLDVVGNKNFELLFYNFRSVVRDLETQIGSIIVNCLNSCWDVRSKLRLLTVFEGVTKRTIVQSGLQKSIEWILDEIEKEVLLCKELIASNQQINGSWHVQLSSYTNKILYIRSVFLPLKEMMEMVALVAPAALKTEKGWKLKDYFSDLETAAMKKENILLEDCIASLTPDLFEKLSQPILVVDDVGLFKVNFDSKIQENLREVYCITSILNIELSGELNKKFHAIKDNGIMLKVSNVNLIVSQFAMVVQNVSDMNKVLLQAKFDKARKLLEYGLEKLTWQDDSLKDFIEDCMFVIGNQLCSSSAYVLHNWNYIQQMVHSWKVDVMNFFDSHSSHAPMTTLLWGQHISAFCQDSNRKLKYDRKKIDDILESMSTELQINQSSPEWLSYMNNVTEFVDLEIYETVRSSIQYLHNKMVLTTLQGESSMNPLIKIELAFIGSDISFVPPLKSDSLAVKSLEEYLLSWVEKFLSKKMFIRTNEVLKMFESKQDSNTAWLVENIHGMISATIQKCAEVEKMFDEYSFLWLQDIHNCFKEFLNGKLFRTNESYDVDVIKKESSAFLGNYPQNDSGSHCSTTTAVTSGISGVKKLRSKTLIEENKKPMLVDFEREIELLQKISSKLLAVDDEVQIGWIRLDLQPIKNSLVLLSSKWLHTYTDYLVQQVISFVESETVFANIEPVIENITGNEAGIATLMKLMKIFNQINQEQISIDKRFIEMKSTVSLLHKCNIKLPTNVEEFYQSAPYRWSNLKMKVNQAKQRLGPQVQTEQHNVIQLLKDFREQCRNAWFEIEDSKIYSRDCSAEKAFLLIEQFTSELADLDSEAQDLLELQLLLNKKIVDFQVIERMKGILSHLSQVWKIYKVIEDRHTEWLRHSWVRIKTKNLKRGLDAQYELVKSLPEEVLGWDITLCMIEMINNIMSCLPIMEDLGKASLRQRHWKHLKKVSSSDVNTTNEEFAKMTLKEFLQLGLQHNSTEVCSIILKSVRDIEIENALKLYEEVWLSKVFEMKKHSRLLNPETLSAGDNSYAGSEFGGTESEYGFSSFVPTSGARRSRLMSVASIAFSGIINFNEDQERYLVYGVDKLLHELYSHQASLQAMTKETAATPFLEEIYKWQKTLQNVELAILLIVEVQNKWIEMEEVFTSNEIHVAFPHETAVFYASSQEFHNIMKQIRKNPNVMHTCLKNNLSHHIEKLSMGFDQCRKAIVYSLEKRRHKYPRLLLLSQQDAFDILCKGYDPLLCCSAISKLFPAISSLQCDIATKTNAYTIVGYTSILGESVALKKPVICENGAEHWLPSFHSAMNNTLRNDLLEIFEDGILRKESSYQSHDTNTFRDVKSIDSADHEQSNWIDRSNVFTFILKAIIPLPQKWKFNAVSDIVSLSLKQSICSLIEESMSSYFDGDSHAIIEVGNVLKAAISALNDFLLAQTKVLLKRKNVDDTDESIVHPSNIDITSSLHSLTEISSKNDKSLGENVNHVLKPYQIVLIQSLIQYFSVEDEFVSHMIEELEKGDMASSVVPADWYFHPKYDIDDDQLNVIVGNLNATYQFDFQGNMNECYSHFDTFKSIYWFLSGFSNYQSGFMIYEGENVVSGNSKQLMETLFGRYIYMYCCSHSMTTNFIMDLFKGAFMSGAWIGFSSVDSMTSSLLLVVASQMQTLHNALKEKRNSVILNSQELNFIPTTAVFVNFPKNMKLPESFVTQFHVVKINVPDMRVILRIHLLKSAMLLATNLIEEIIDFLFLIQKLFPCFSKLMNLHRLASISNSIYKIYGELLKWKDGQIIVKELLSVMELNDHDRNVTEENVSKIESDGKEEIEEKLQYQAVIIGLYEELSPSLTSDELAVFKDLLHKSFPYLDVRNMLEDRSAMINEIKSIQEDFDVEKRPSSDATFQVIENVSLSQCWIPYIKTKVTEVLQLFHSNKLVSVCSENINVVTDVINNSISIITQLFHDSQVYTINLDALESKNIFGYYCDKKKAWVAGVIPTLFKQMKCDKYHIIQIHGFPPKNIRSEFFDFLLTEDVFRLSNGTTIQMNRSIKFLWRMQPCFNEKYDALGYPSVYVEENAVTIYDQLSRHFHANYQSSSEHLITLFKTIFTCVDGYTSDEGWRRLSTYNNMQTAILIFESISSHVHISSDFDNYVYYAAFWACYSNMESLKREEFSIWWNKTWSSELGYPIEKQFWSLFVNPDTNLLTDVEESSLFVSVPNSNMMIHSDYTMASGYLMHALIKASQSFFISGSYGCGKSAILKKEILQHKPDGRDFEILFIDANDCLSNDVVWEIINEVLEWMHSSYYVAAGNKKLICVIEDLHLIKVNDENTSSVICLLEELVVKKRAFNPSKNQWQEINDIVFILSFNPQEVYHESNPVISFANQLPNIFMDYPPMGEQINIFYTLLLQHFVLMEDQQLFLIDHDSLTIQQIKRKQEVLALEELLKTLVTVSVETQENLKEMFLKTPGRSHYQFTLKKLDRLFRRFCMTVKNSWDHDYIVKCWHYEFRWLYGQMFTDEVDGSRFQKAFYGASKKHFKKLQMDLLEKEVPIFTTSDYKVTSHDTTTLHQFQSHDYSSEKNELQTYLKQAAIDHNRENQPVKIYLYEFNVRLVYRLLHSFEASFSNGHILIKCDNSTLHISMLIHLAASIINYEVYQMAPANIFSSSASDFVQLKQELKQVLVKCALKKKKIIVMAINDLNNLSNNSLYMLVQELFSGGTMAHLFTGDEKLSILNEMRTSGDHDVAQLSSIELWNVFLKGVKKNFKFIGIVGDSSLFNKISSQYPSLMASSEIIFVNNWLKSDLIQNAKLILKEKMSLQETFVENLAHLFTLFHTEVKETIGGDLMNPLSSIFTNLNFELVIERFCLLYTQKREQLRKQREELNEALKVITISSNMNLQHTKKLQHEKMVYQQKLQGCNTLLTQIGQDQAISDEQIKLIKKTKESMQRLEKIIPQYEEIHKRSVFKAAAVVKETKDIIINIDMKGLSNLRFMQKTDQEIEDVLAAIIIITKSPTSDLTWNRGAKRIMANLERFKEDMISFDEVTLPQSTMEILQSYVAKPHFALHYLSDRMQNNAVHSLISYVRGVIRYNYLMQSYVKPYHEKVTQTKQSLEDTRQKLSMLENKSKGVRDRLETLMGEFEEATVAKIQQLELIDELNTSLNKASKFDKVLKKLSCDWKQTILDLDTEENNMFSKLLLAAAYSVYLIPCSYDIRKKVICECWLPILENQNVKLRFHQELKVATQIRSSDIESDNRSSDVESDNRSSDIESDNRSSDIESDNRSSDVESDNQSTFEYAEFRKMISECLCGEDIHNKILLSNPCASQEENMSFFTSPFLKRPLILTDPDKKLEMMVKYIKKQDQPTTEFDFLDSESNFGITFEKAVSSGHLFIVHNVQSADNVLLVSAILSIFVASQTDGKCFINFHKHRLLFHPQFQLVLVSYEKEENFSAELYTLCESINLSTINENVAAEFSYKILSASYHGNIFDDITTNLHTYLSWKRFFQVVKEYTICKVLNEMDGMYPWKNADEITSLVEIETQISNELNLSYDVVVSTRQKICLLEKIGKKIVQLLAVFHHLDQWERYYVLSSNIFTSIFEDCLCKQFNRDSLNDTHNSSEKKIFPNVTSIDDICTLYEQFSASGVKKIIFNDLSKEQIDNVLIIFIKRMYIHLKRIMRRDDLNMFGFIEMMLIKIQDGDITKHLLRNLFSINKKVQTNELLKPSWMQDQSFRSLCNIFNGCDIFEEMINNLAVFETWYNHPTPEKIPLPISNCNTEVTWLFVVALRSDRFSYVVEDFLSNNISDEQSKSLSILEVFDKSNRPIVFVGDSNINYAEEIVSDFAQKMDVRLEVIKGSEGYERLDTILTLVVQNDCYLLIKHMEVCSDEFAKNLFNRCRRLHSQYSTSKWKIFLVSKRSEVFDQAMLQYYQFFSTDALMSSDKHINDSMGEILKENLERSCESACKIISFEEIMDGFYEKFFLFLCCWHALLLSFQYLWSGRENPPAKYLIMAIELFKTQLLDNEFASEEILLGSFIDNLLKNIYYDLDSPTFVYDEIIANIFIKPIVDNADGFNLPFVNINFSDIKRNGILKYMRQLEIGQPDSGNDGMTLVNYNLDLRRRNLSKSEVHLQKMKSILSYVLPDNQTQPTCVHFSKMKDYTSSKKLSSVLCIIQSRIPPQLTPPVFNEHAQSSELSLYMLQEFVHFNKKLSDIRKEVNLLLNVNIERASRYSDRVKILVTSFCKDLVPTTWLSPQDGNMICVDNWLKHLNDDWSMMQTYSADMDTKTFEMNSPMNLSMFHAPKDFLYLTMRAFAKLNSYEMDKVYWKCTLQDEHLEDLKGKSIFVNSLWVDDAIHQSLTNLSPQFDAIVSDPSMKILPPMYLCVSILPVEKNCSRFTLFWNRNSKEELGILYLPQAEQEDMRHLPKKNIYLSPA